jgi:hypothetical protein
MHVVGDLHRPSLGHRERRRREHVRGSRISLNEDVGPWIDADTMASNPCDWHRDGRVHGHQRLGLLETTRHQPAHTGDHAGCLLWLDRHHFESSISALPVSGRDNPVAAVSRKQRAPGTVAPSDRG